MLKISNAPSKFKLILKHVTYILGLLLGFAFPAAGQAQGAVTTIDSLVIDLWPDYDRTAVLVLLTGTLPADTTLPATVTLPLPPEADLNAVARISTDNVMTDDVDYNTGNGQLMFTTPDLRFRVEYYVPYTADGDQRAFTYTWTADLTVNQLEITVQQPAAATTLLTEPEAVTVTTGSSDGLQYHTLPAQTVPAGQPLAVTVNYTMSSSQLSAESLQGATAPDTTSPAAAPSSNSPPVSRFDWPVLLAVAGVGLVIAAITWQIATMRASSKRPPKPRKVRSSKKGKGAAVRFCHQCGQSLQKGDRFCRQCGTAVKTR